MVCWHKGATWAGQVFLPPEVREQSDSLQRPFGTNMSINRLLLFMVLQIDNSIYCIHHIQHITAINSTTEQDFLFKTLYIASFFLSTSTFTRTTSYYGQNTIFLTLLTKISISKYFFTCTNTLQSAKYKQGFVALNKKVLMWKRYPSSFRVGLGFSL